MLGSDPPPPRGTAGRAAPAQTPLPARRPRRGRGGLGKWASVPSPPPQSNFLPAKRPLHVQTHISLYPNSEIVASKATHCCTVSHPLIAKPLVGSAVFAPKRKRANAQHNGTPHPARQPNNEALHGVTCCTPPSLHTFVLSWLPFFLRGSPPVYVASRAIFF